MNFVSKRWGYELWIENSKDYCGKHLHVIPNQWCSFHYHKKVKNAHNPRWDWQHTFTDKTDLYYNFKTKVLKKGDNLTIEPYILHTFTANTSEPCDFIEVSTFHEDSDSHRIYT